MTPAFVSPPFRDLTVGDLLSRVARALPDRPARLYENGPRYTFAGLEREARLVARGLIAHDVQPGERVVVWATNVPEWIVLQSALVKVGAILVTANTSLRANEIEYLMRQSGAATLMTISGFRGVDYIAELEQMGVTSRKEIEDCLREHPAVADAYVYGVPDDFFSEVVAAAVRVRPAKTRPGHAQAPPSADALILWCGERLARFKVAKVVRFVTEFAMTASGKAQKFKLREEHVARHS